MMAHKIENPILVSKKYFDPELECGAEASVPDSVPPDAKGVLKSIVSNWRLLIIIFLPLVFSPLLFIQEDDIARPDSKFKCAYVAILMIVSWMLQLLPIPVTSLLPFLLFPVLGVLDSAQVSKNYVKETTVLFVGGLIIALAIEYSNLHRRIALKIMTSVGYSPRRLTLGIMVTTAFLSMWINNTATAGMAIPIVSATVVEIFPEKRFRMKKRRLSAFKETSSESDLEDFEQEKTVSKSPTHYNDELKATNLRKMLLLSVCLAANIGGTGVITGSPSNLIFQEFLKTVNVSQNGKYMDISFATWMLYNIPPVTVNLLFCWIYLVTYFDGVPEWVYFWRKPTDEQILQQQQEIDKQSQVETILLKKYEELGTISFHESAVLFLFVVAILLWFSRAPGFISGWAQYFPEIGESTVAVLVVLLLFVIPRPTKATDSISRTNNPTLNLTLLDWKYVQDSIPWGLVILLGGGFAMADGVVRSGLSDWLGTKLMRMNSLPTLFLLLTLMTFTVICTSVASNSATASTMLSLLVPLSRSLKLHPLYLTLPSTVACSYAFLLPISTPPNALIHQAAGRDFSVGEMVKVMSFPNIICIIVLFLFHISYGNLIFQFENYVYQEQ